MKVKRKKRVKIVKAKMIKKVLAKILNMKKIIKIKFENQYYI